MTCPVVWSRREQVDELTRGVQLPLPPIADDHLIILAEGLQQAFDDVRASAPTTVAVGDEPEVTALLEARLNRLINEDFLWGQLVLCVARGKECISFDGSHLEKRPDLSIFLTGRERAFPLIAEAKILDKATSKTVGRYCKNGICRFVKGEYAWGNCEAFMIGYVRDGSLIDATLKPALAKAIHSHPHRYLVEALPVPARSGSSDLAYTRHGRAFVYRRHRRPTRPGPIVIWHLWLA